MSPHQQVLWLITTCLELFLAVSRINELRPLALTSLPHRAPIKPAICRTSPPSSASFSPPRPAGVDL